MIIKKFQGKTEEEAIEAAKKELGVNVVVMNVKNVLTKKNALQVRIGRFHWRKDIKS